MSAELTDLLDLLALFQKHGVRYRIVGGLAVNRHGHHRTTGRRLLANAGNPQSKS